MIGENDRMDFADIHRFPDTESNSWFIWKKSEYAGYHWNNDGAGPYVRIWNDKYGVTLMLSEDRDSSDLLMKKIIGRIYFNIIAVLNM